jgi:hypothetical protein
MPGYGIAGPTEGSGLLPWSWAEERLLAAHDYWVASLHEDGRPHVMPVWGVWADGCVWFSSSAQSRKARNLDRDPRATVTTDNPKEPVVLEGAATKVTGRADAKRFTDLFNAKYGIGQSVEFFLANALFRIQPDWAFGLVEADFTGSPTRWTFGR